MKIVKVQKRQNDTILTVPATMERLLDGIEYMKCTEVENGILYTKVIDGEE